MPPSDRSSALTIYAPVSGIVVPLDEVPDPAFAQRLAGDGLAIDPLDQRVVAPCDAKVMHVHRARHALTLSAQGLDILIHVGLDTVKLDGSGFRPSVKPGDSVRKGDTLITFDADYLATHARSLISPVLVTNMDQVTSLMPRTGKVRAGQDALLEVTLGRPTTPVTAGEAQGEAIRSSPIVIRNDTGLHARPAAVVAAAARQFTSDIRLVKGTREANARSVVSIMALEVSRGDTVTIVARGEDAQRAIDGLTKTLTTDIVAHAEPPARAATRAPAPPRAAAPASPAAEGALRGVPASPGVAIGRVFQLRHEDIVLEERASDPNHERRELDAAIASAHLQLETMHSRLATEADADRAAIFAAHQELLEDPEVLDAASAHIRNGASAAWAWQQAYTAQASRLAALDNPLLAGRAADMRDVGRRVLHLLVGREDSPMEVPAESIVVAEDLTPTDAASLDRTRVRGFCTTMGSATSHVAILARGLGIPAVAGIDPRVLDIDAGTRVVLDGDAGTLHIGPTGAEEQEIAQRQAVLERKRTEDLAVAGKDAVTRDGHRVEIVANIGDEKEAKQVPAVGGEGVGLLRSEFLFMERRTAPNEDEQARVYENIAKALGPERILVIRTLDVGGDKPLSYLPMGTEANPFLGERGVRLMLNRPEIFRTQVRAILRASRSTQRLAVMFPMISTIAEWRAARAVVEAERKDLGTPPVEVGIMVETASAALMADVFAKEADFFSIGTNDLTQYTLAMDRTNPRLAPQVDALHPSVLRLIHRTVEGAAAHNRWVGVCGALAGDLQAVPVLLGLGVDELSVSVPIVPAVKARVRALSLEECKETARLALDAADGGEVRAIVAKRHG